MNEQQTIRSHIFTQRSFHNGVQNVLREKRMLIVLTVLHFAAAPLITLIALGQILISHMEPEIEVYAGIGVCTTGAACLWGIACAFTAMPYLYKRTTVDMRLSLPMSSTQRFASDYLSGLFVYMAPFLVNQAFTSLLLLLGHILCDGRDYVYHYHSGEAVRWHCDIFGTAASYYFRILFAAVLIMIMFYTISVLTMTFCGSLMENICYTAMFNALVPAVIALVSYAVSEAVKGAVFEGLCFVLLPYTSPLGGCIYYIMMMEEDSTFLEYAMWALGFIFCTLVYLSLAFWLYKKRSVKAEYTGKPVVYTAFYHVLMVLVVACVVYGFMAIDEDMIIASMIVSAIGYLVMSVIKNRGFKKFGKVVLSFVVTYVAIIGSYLLIIGTECFGAGRFVPDPMTVQRCYINYLGFDDRVYSSSMSLEYSQTGAMFTDKDNIRTVTDLHRYIIDAGEEDIEGENEVVNFCIVYKTMLGRTIMREYRIPADVMTDKLIALDTTDEMKTARIKKATAEIWRAARRIREVRTRRRSDMPESRWDISVSAMYVTDANTQYIREPVMSDSFYSGLIDALAKDIMAETPDQYFGRTKSRMGYLNVGSYSITITEDYTNTLSFLQGYGINGIPVIDREMAESLLYNFTINLTNNELEEYIDGEHNPLYTGYESYYSNDYNTITVTTKNLYTEELIDIITHSRKHSVSENGKFLISLGNGTAIPDESCNELARDIYISNVMNKIIYGVAYDYREDSYSLFLMKFAEFYKDRIIERYGKDMYDVLVTYARTGENTMYKYDDQYYGYTE
ncbi:MAG: hypothetical protein K6G68_02965 [Oscillospiraceae bacterium]|nr:hypothetical protein [Oscillospiraceae bacterium]